MRMPHRTTALDSLAAIDHLASHSPSETQQQTVTEMPGVSYFSADQVRLAASRKSTVSRYS